MLYSQTVPAGIAYQAVARDKYGEEICNTEIDVRFSVLQGSPAGAIVYQEVYLNEPTSNYGVFSLVIGQGTKVGGTAASFAEVDWSAANHYLKVEVKFENDYMDMGTMQFLAVPYAMYAAKSLEPGPQGPQGEQGLQGEPGDPATDDQTLSVENVDGSDYLAISGGNQVKISSIEEDGDVTNELQDLRLNNDILTLTKISDATQINLAPYNQALTYNAGTSLLGISGNTTTIDLSGLKNDADANPANEIQKLTYDDATNALTISGTGGNSAILGSAIAFRAGLLSTSVTFPSDLIFNLISGNYFNEGNHYNPTTGVFQAPYSGIYCFNVSLLLPYGSLVIIKVGGAQYDTILGPAASKATYAGSIVIKLAANDVVSIALINDDSSSGMISGSFSGFRVK